MPFGDGNALVLGLVGEHRPAHDIADAQDILQIGSALVIDGDEPAFVLQQSDRSGAETRGVRHSTDRNDETIEGGTLFAAFGIGVTDRRRRSCRA
jgi:hypothetical protein